MKKIPNWLKLILKLVVSGGCLYYVSRKIDFTETFNLLRQAHWVWLCLAFVAFMLSKFVSALRLQYYWKNIALTISQPNNLRLYWLGMFYNLFLPGGIGGDAYKVLLLRKSNPEITAKKTGAAVLLDRISGVAGLGILAAIVWMIIYPSRWYGIGAVIAILPGLGLYYFVIKKWFPSFINSFLPTLWLGIAVQAIQLLCIWFIMQSVDIQHHTYIFLLLFLLSSIVAIFPFTIGGLGARELVFLWGATQFVLADHEAVFISLLFYAITLVGSLPGIIWVFKHPLREHKNT